MSYLALTFPARIALGALRHADWSTTLNKTFGGWTQRNANRSRILHSWDIAFAIRTTSDYDAVVAHFHEARGRANSFPFRDYLDFAATASEGVLTLISGSTYQLYKRYGSVNPFDRKITRPRSPIVVYRTRGGSTSVISPTVSYTTGQVTVSGHVGGDTYTWAGEFDVPCFYSSDSLPGAIVNRQPGEAGEHYVQCESIMIEEDFE